MKSLFNNTTNYINTYSKKIDEEQNPQNEVLQVTMNFDVFDEDTIKNDIYSYNDKYFKCYICQEKFERLDLFYLCSICDFKYCRICVDKMVLQEKLKIN